MKWQGKKQSELEIAVNKACEVERKIKQTVIDLIQLQKGYAQLSALDERITGYIKGRG